MVLLTLSLRDVMMAIKYQEMDVLQHVEWKQALVVIIRLSIQVIHILHVSGRAQYLLVKCGFVNIKATTHLNLSSRSTRRSISGRTSTLTIFCILTRLIQPTCQLDSSTVWSIAIMWDTRQTAIDFGSSSTISVIVWNKLPSPSKLDHMIIMLMLHFLLPIMCSSCQPLSIRSSQFWPIIIKIPIFTLPTNTDYMEWAWRLLI